MGEQPLQRIEGLEQAFHTSTVQLQSYEAQLNEIASAREELQNTDEAYRIIAGIMVKTDAKRMLQELDEKHATMQARIKQLQKQQQQFRKQIEELRQQVLGDTHE